VKLARRHGALIKGVARPQFRLGIWKVFDPWINPRLQALQGHTVPARSRPLRIEFHFQHVVQRLARSLGRLYQRLREWDRFLEAGGIAGTEPEMVYEIPEEAGIAADSVFHYLNLFVDDLARVIPFALAEEGVEAKEPNGFSKLKKRILDGGSPGASRTLHELFAELDGQTSWWSLGFKRAVGMRQRLTHYTDLVMFRGSTKAGDSKISGDVSLATVGGPVHIQNFEKTVENLLTDLCEWLDRLDQELLTHLSAKLARREVPWNPFNEAVPALDLPETDAARLDVSHYLYLPVCDKS
jgi:hypothetical protein